MVTSNVQRALRCARSLLTAVAVLCSLAGAARADDEAPQLPREARVHHAPIAAAKAHEDLTIRVSFEHGEQIRAANLVYTAKKGPFRVVPLLRGPGEDYLAIIPGEEVVAPGVAYAIELERLDGRHVDAFASRAVPQPVQVMEDRADVREEALKKRLDGRRSAVTTTGEFVRFGRELATLAGTTTPVEDQYWRVEGGYTYRPMRTVAEFGLRIGVVRGTSLSPTSQDFTGKDPADRYKVGLNYAQPSVRFRMHDAWHLDVSILTSITEIGFSVGGGGALLIGDPYGTRLTLGAEFVGISKSTYFGSRFFAELDLLVWDRVIVGPVIEVTDMPHADDFGVRLYGDVMANLGRGFSLGVRGGYQARRWTSGGLGIGGTMAYAF